MDTIFTLRQVERAAYLQMLMQSFGSTYICLWSYLPCPSNCLLLWDGYIQDEVANQPRARALFQEYQQGIYPVVNDRVPGQAFVIESPFIELQEMDLHSKASVRAQRQFYQEARIKTAIFMGCKSGEIELGWSRVTGINVENEMRNWFPEDFSRKSSLAERTQAVDPIGRYSSSSSRRSLSMDTPDTSFFLFNIPGTSQIRETLQEYPSLQPPPSTTSALQAALQYSHPIPNINSPRQQALHSIQSIPSPLTSPLQQARQSLQPLPCSSSTSQLQRATQTWQSLPHLHTTIPHQEAIQNLALTSESVDATMRRAIVALLNNSPSSSSSTTQNLPFVPQERENALKNSSSALACTKALSTNLQRQSMLKRSITYAKSLNIATREHMLPNHRISTQFFHSLNERKRREKLNESFQALRSLLSPDTKKDKASVLIRTRDCLTSLKDQVEELSRRNQQLEAQLSLAKEAAGEVSGAPSTERFDVQLLQVSESTSSEQVVHLQVTVRGEHSLLNMVSRLLDFLKQVENMNVVSVQASTHLMDSNHFNRIVLGLTIEGSEWDEPAFQEAVRRLLTDLAGRQVD
ncbi:hypothetical protein K2173_011728 [Erythroxylum novogranatense]|uniref:BHLH domain-containing protein n=1 Tax=Erythroxylum novogranatense TaxID=1862640 RepID=A0AAV8TKU6_9ROSI|nr:hypothetical protein K2173_011728 [Erythroxylum novogranatense]